jgi:hypothetical protein
MEYNKPEVAVLELAIRVVQSTQKGIHAGADWDYLTSVSAYEADE